MRVLHAGHAVSATALLRETPIPPRRRSGSGSSGNLCRCTGYDGIVRAVKQAASGEVGAIGAPAYHTDATPPHHAG